MFASLTRYSKELYLVLLGLGEIFGLLSVILVGLLFNENIFTVTYDWKERPFSFHPLLMTLGLLFCYGNAIILYRTFLKVPKYPVKILHALLLILSLVFAIVGFVAIINSKNSQKRSHFMTFHSWIGLATIILFVLQWILGFVSFLFPQLSLDFRKGYMPSHRLWGKIIFLSAVVAILTGLSEHIFATVYAGPPFSDQRRRLIMNFFGVFTSLFALIIIYLLSNPEYQRPADVIVDRREHSLE